MHHLCVASSVYIQRSSHTCGTFRALNSRDCPLQAHLHCEYAEATGRVRMIGASQISIIQAEVPHRLHVAGAHGAQQQ